MPAAIDRFLEIAQGVMLQLCFKVWMVMQRSLPVDHVVKLDFTDL